MRRLYLHVGMMKTGTTYLQAVWRENRDALDQQGIWFPAGPDQPKQWLAFWDVVGRRPRGAPDARVAGQWAALTEGAAQHADDTVLLSEEYLAARPTRVARRVVAGFPHHEVHVIVTARDFGRSLVSAWQEYVKSGRTVTWRDFADGVKDPENADSVVSRKFWLHHDLPGVVDTWSAAVGPDRVHVVTLPPPGSPAGVLLSRVGGLVGYDATALGEPSGRTNESLGAPAIETLRRLNVLIDGQLNQRQYEFVVKRSLVSRLPAATPETRVVLSDQDLAWASEQARRTVDHLRSSGVDVVGSLDDLLPQSGTSGRAPDHVDPTELADTALEALAGLTRLFARRWWRSNDSEVPTTTAAPPTTRAVSLARGSAHRVKQALADRADDNRTLSRALKVYLRLRRGRLNTWPK